MINIIYYYYFMILAMEGEEASDGSGSKRMSDGCYKRSNRRSNGSESKGWIKEKFEGGGKL